MSSTNAGKPMEGLIDSFHKISLLYRDWDHVTLYIVRAFSVCWKLSKSFRFLPRVSAEFVFSIYPLMHVTGNPLVFHKTRKASYGS